MEKENASSLTVKEKLLKRGVYYIVEANGASLSKNKKVLYLILATSEKAAINKMKRGEQRKFQFECIGIYNKKDNTLLLKNADHILDFSKYSVIED